MPLELVEELTRARLVNARKVTQLIVSWLLPDDFPASYGEELDNREVDMLVAGARLGKAQRLALWGYLYCLIRLDPDAQARERAESLMPLLAVRTRHADIMRGGIDAVLDSLSPRPTAPELFERPPRELVDAITEAAVECQRSSPATARRILYGLQGAEFIHPSDGEASSLVRNLPADVTAQAADFIKRRVEVDVMASSVLVTQDSIPSLHQRYLDACRVLDVTSPPPLYLAAGGVKAYTVGVEEPMIVMESMAASLLDARETAFLLGRELGHIIAGHQQGRSLAETLVGAFSLPFGDLLAFGLKMKLNNWVRYTDFTADRAGYLACQSMEAALRAMLKMSGYPARHYDEMHPRSLAEQAQAFRSRLDSSRLDKAYNFLGTVSAAASPTIVRTQDLLDWVEAGHADDIINQRDL
jgi:Zn-dependent protease with chaperone function